MSQAKDPKAWTAFTQKLPKSKAIVFHCAAGVRSKRAAGKLAWKDLRRHTDGADQWAAAGLPVVKRDR